MKKRIEGLYMSFGIRGGFSGEEDAEVVTGSFSGLFEFLFQLWQPTGHQMNVLQDDPMSILTSLFQRSFGDDILS